MKTLTIFNFLTKRIVYILSHNLWNLFYHYLEIFIYLPENELVMQHTIKELDFIYNSFLFLGLALCSNKNQTPVIVPSKDLCESICRSADYYCDVVKQIKQIKTVKGGNVKIYVF